MCIYIYTYIYIDICTYIGMHAHIHAHIIMFVYVYIYTHTFLKEHMDWSCRSPTYWPSSGQPKARLPEPICKAFAGALPLKTLKAVMARFLGLRCTRASFSDDLGL